MTIYYEMLMFNGKFNFFLAISSLIVCVMDGFGERFDSYALFDMDGNQVPQELVAQVGELFESILKEVNVVIQYNFLAK